MKKLHHWMIALGLSLPVLAIAQQTGAAELRPLPADNPPEMAAPAYGQGSARVLETRRKGNLAPQAQPGSGHKHARAGLAKPGKAGKAGKAPAKAAHKAPGSKAKSGALRPGSKSSAGKQARKQRAAKHKH